MTRHVRKIWISILGIFLLCLALGVEYSSGSSASNSGPAASPQNPPPANPPSSDPQGQEKPKPEGERPEGPQQPAGEKHRVGHSKLSGVIRRLLPQERVRRILEILVAEQTPFERAEDARA